jgi:hypothetical protein
MAKTNLTLQLDADVVQRAKIMAAKRRTSVSALVAKELDELVNREDRYEASRLRAFELLDRARPRGGRTWRREDLYDRVERHGR